MIQTLKEVLASLGYWWWIPSMTIYYYYCALMSKKFNEVGSMRYGIILYLLACLCPIWLLVSWTSQDIFFDGMLYDNLVFLISAFSFIVLGCGHHFRLIQWMGVGFVIIGSVLMRIV
jgi:hypothetical protein